MPEKQLETEYSKYISVKRVRRKMAAKRWKRIQRWAYGFYGLIYIHVLVLYLPSALRGRGAFIFTIVLYTIVWFAYLIVRLRKSSAAYCQ